MLDMKFVRENLPQVQEMLKHRCNALDLSSFTELEERRRAILQDVEEKKARRNAVSKEIGVRKKAGESADDVVAEMRALGDEIAALDEDLRDVELRLRELLLQIPNMPKADVPIGVDDTENPEVRRWGTPRTFDFEPQAHWDIGEKLGVLDAERAAKVTGARFTFYKGLGARLERACINFMMDLHAQKHGYTEMLAPYIVNEASMIGTGQLPKFAEDMFKLEGLDYYLVPTAEVPTTNYHRDEILDAEQLPEYFTSYTACFRAEAGSAGRDTRGLIRQHQFEKVELVKICTPEQSFAELESLLADAEETLQLLELPYRVVALCSGDIGFGAAKTYDLEVWLPSQGKYREISSCSNCEDFQARRMDTRYRPAGGGRPRFVHTLNGSGVAIGRALIAVLENGQAQDGSIRIPEALVPYMGGVAELRRN